MRLFYKYYIDGCNRWSTTWQECTDDAPTNKLLEFVTEDWAPAKIKVTFNDGSRYKYKVVA
jgi:hypothetical protein